MKEVRAQHGQLIGVLEESEGVFCIKERGKKTYIEVSFDGFCIYFTPRNGEAETVCIPPWNLADKP